MKISLAKFCHQVWGIRRFFFCQSTVVYCDVTVTVAQPTFEAHHIANMLCTGSKMLALVSSVKLLGDGLVHPVACDSGELFVCINARAL